MSTSASQRVRIQQALIALAKEGEFFPVSYDGDDCPIQVNPSTDQPLAPASVHCNEVPTTVFEPDPTMGRRLAFHRQTWRFELRCRWDREVTLESFEQAISDNPPVLAADSETGLGQVRLTLVRSDPTHPTTQQPSSGTSCVFSFEAVLNRP